MATVSMIESIDDSVKVAEYELPNPKIKLDSVTDKVETTGPVLAISLGSTAGTGYDDGPVECTTTGAGTGLTVQVTAALGVVDGATIVNAGTGYATGADVVTINDAMCGDGLATLTIDSLHDQNTITISNLGSEAVQLSHIYITLSDTATYMQGNPFQFSSEYSGSNLFIFPGEEISSDEFPLDTDKHGFAIDTDPDRAFLAVYDHSSAVSVTIS
tara:strand:- start:204 stop:848 length:645 start_codon:yes stop_codon:yes gene_type:complete